MTTKQLLVLLTPSLFFLIIGITAFLFSNEFLRDHATDTNLRAKNQELDARLERLVNNLTNGTWQFTTDQWIERMQKACVAIQAQREFQSELQTAQDKLTTITWKLIRLLGWAAVAGFIFQMIAILYFKQSKQNKTSPLLQNDK